LKQSILVFDEMMKLRPLFAHTDICFILKKENTKWTRQIQVKCVLPCWFNC